MIEVKYVIIYGNVVDGISLRGPFDTAAEAVDYATDRDNSDEQWVVAEMALPEE